jgi:hypothetical protein
MAPGHSTGGEFAQRLPAESGAAPHRRQTGFALELAHIPGRRAFCRPCLDWSEPPFDRQVRLRLEKPRL